VCLVVVFLHLLVCCARGLECTGFIRCVSGKIKINKKPGNL
jgi:hypothetical protein